jgi:ATP-dependent DNA ligase
MSPSIGSGSLRRRALMAFDLLGLDGAYLMSMPLYERRRRLATVLEEAGRGSGSPGLWRASRV